MTASPQLLHAAMAGKRVPLASVPNAANSPLRPIAAAAGMKRSRGYPDDQRENGYGQSPPAKKQVINVDSIHNRRQIPARRPVPVRPNAFQKKLESLRVSKQAQRGPEKASKSPDHGAENLENIRLWQKHYRKVFPQLVFYFESIPEDVRVKASRYIQVLGAREEKFFSKAVTHIVTSRSIPSEAGPSNTSSSQVVAPTMMSFNNINSGTRTINPSLLHRPSDAHNHVLQQRAKLALDASFQKRLQPSSQTHHGDILHKARELGIKIWALEKLQRILDTMFNTETGEQPAQVPLVRSTNIYGGPKAGKGLDLSQLLQNEKATGTADRDWTTLSQDLVHFRGFYIYVHDMDEKTRPVMARDYGRPEAMEDGEWPQLRMTGPGKCPFIDENSRAKRVESREARKAGGQEEEKSQMAPRTLTATVAENKDRVQATTREMRVFGDVGNTVSRAPPESLQRQNTKNNILPLEPPKRIPVQRENIENMPPIYGTAQSSFRRPPRIVGGEPIASGVQPSQITSAIRSQMISSTAAAPGARAGASKEIHHLKRKVLERNHGPSTAGVPSSYVNDVRAAINYGRSIPSRSSRPAGQDVSIDAHNERLESAEALQRRKIASEQRKPSKESKPGYCENCHEKFDDFDEHVMDRKHRKFALTASNWKELDQLLDQLQRPLKRF